MGFSASDLVSRPNAIRNLIDSASFLRTSPVQDVDPATTIFCTTHNYVYDTTLVSIDVPYGRKGFITIKKGGDAAIYRVGQATVTGWPAGGTVFQNSVGYKVGDVIGTPTANDPRTAIINP